jgi:hypothetical protein
MKEAADAAKFRNFAEAHRQSVYQKILARARRRCGDPHWVPTGMLSGGGLWFGAQVDEQLTKLYRRLAVKRQAPDYGGSEVVAAHKRKRAPRPGALRIPIPQSGFGSPGDHFLPFFAPFFMGLYRHELPLQPPS